MIRSLLLLTIVLSLTFYAWKDWYKSLCGLIVLMAVLQHPDMPRTIFGVPGLNAWNILFFTIVIAWLSKRRSERLRWDMPQVFGVLLLLYLGVILIGFFVLILDRHSLPEEVPILGLTIDYLFNPVKWILIGLMLFDGCRGRRRLLLGLASILSLYFLLGLQVARWTSPSAFLSGIELSSYTLRRLNQEIGYHRNDLSTMLAGASWAILALRPLATSARLRGGVIAAALIVLYAQVITGGRGGYLAWCTVGLVLGLLRWRGYLVVAPLMLIVVVSFFPAVAERALWGVQSNWPTSPEDMDFEEFTAGRTFVWPKVIDKSFEAPLFGHGRASFERTGLSAWWAAQDGAEVGPIHPHNAYLEMLLDSGVIGLLVTLALYGYLVTAGLSLVRDRRSPLFLAVGGIALSLILAQLAGSFTGQSLYPREATVGMWGAIGLLLRVSVQRSRAAADSRNRKRGWQPAHTNLQLGTTARAPDLAPSRSQLPEAHL